MPAEWQPHERCWMAWPNREGMWPDPEGTCAAYRDVAHAVAEFEPVTMVVPPHLLDQARNYLGSDISILEMPLDDSWARDIGPNFVIDGKGGLAGVCFGFNAWGEKYFPYADDARMGENVLKHLGLPVFKSKLIAEGGGLCVDGEGTLLTTESCFPNSNRNPDWSREEIEGELCSQLGVEKVIWLPGDPLDQETDGHVDGVALFAKPGTVVLEISMEDHDVERQAYFAALREALEGQTDARGRPLELWTLPEAESERALSDNFCLSYINFYMANGAIIAPAYDVYTDGPVRECLQDFFPDRSICMLPIDAIACGGGGIHCITQQQPRVD